MNYPEFEKLTQVVKQLRHPKDGCPWDLEQTHQTLVKYLIEESFEFAHAAETNDTKAMEEELGDVLLQILLHTTIGEENKSYDLESVSRILREKLIRRHPHVFEKKDSNIDVSDVVTNWEKIKAEEKENTDNPTSTKIKPDVLNFPASLLHGKLEKKQKRSSSTGMMPLKSPTKSKKNGKSSKKNLSLTMVLTKKGLRKKWVTFFFQRPSLLGIWT